MEDHNPKTEIVEIKCDNCGKDVYVRRDFVRENMFCTLGCMDRFKKEIKS